MANFDERQIIRLFAEELGGLYYPGSKVALFDDAGEIEEIGYLFNIDGYSSFNSKYPWEDWDDWAWKAVVGSITDLIAKGARPQYIGLSIGIKKENGLEISRKIAKGIKEVCEKFDLRVIKADTNRSLDDIWINVASLGKLTTSRPISRRGMREGDRLYTTYVNGYGRLTALYNMYRRGKIGTEKARHLYKRPAAPLKFLTLAQKIDVSSSIDCSDGLAFTLGELSKENEKSINLENIPEANSELMSLYESAEVMQREVLYGGEEYEIVFSTSSSLEDVNRECMNIGLRCVYLGRVMKGKGGKIYFIDKEIPSYGWSHF